MHNFHFLSAFFLSLISLGFGDKTIGFPEHLTEEYQNAECQSKGVPTWLKGTFVRQQCGAFGSPRGSGRRAISHMFDCLGMLNAFKFDSGRVTFSSKYFDTEAYRSWNPKKRDLDPSGTSISWRTLFTDIDQQAFDGQKSTRTSTNKADTVDASPTGGIWETDSHSCRLSSYSDAPAIYDVNLHNGQLNDMKRSDLFKDNDNASPPWPKDSITLHNSAHAHPDEDGNLWGVTLMARNTSSSVYDLFHLIYKIEPGLKKRSYITDTLSSRRVDMARCQESGGRWTYRTDASDTDTGYINEIAITKNYIVLIENSYIFNPCALHERNRAAAKPFLATWFEWRNSQLKIHLISKTDNRLKHSVSFSPPVFISQTVNAFEERPEEGGYVVIDAVVHPRSDVLTRNYAVETLMSSSSSWPNDAAVNRYAIDAVTGRASRPKNLLPDRLGDTVSSELFAINDNMRGDYSYSYFYLLINPFSDISEIWKINLQEPLTGQIIRSTTDPGVYLAGQPTFVPRSNRTAAGKEDDGVVLVPAFSSDKKKGLLLIYDGASLSEVGRVEAPDLITYGTYSRFVPTCSAAPNWRLKSIAKLFLACVLVFCISFYRM